MSRRNWDKARKVALLRQRGSESISGHATPPAAFAHHVAATAPRPTATRPTLPEPIVIARWWRNRAGQAVVVRLGDYHGRPMVDLRIWFTADDGVLKPTTKGLSLHVRHLPQLLSAISKALAKARELGLLDEEEPR
jgi:hypothetical protein